MFKKLGMIMLVVVMLASVVALVGCSSSTSGGNDVPPPGYNGEEPPANGNGGTNDVVTNNDVAHVLAGTTWAWDASDLYLYVFNADGTGTRGLDGMLENFTWTTPGTGRLNMNVTGGINEQWNYTIEDNVLTIDSRQVPGMEFSYILVD